jgi:creatinine amidohydrolase/Fe(II)-dependent formamide hydrolase-like protein
MFLERMKATDFDPKKKYTFVVSMGATEQHGPFLPLGTDSYIQEAIIQRLERGVAEAIFLPTLRITCSKEHSGFPGSVWIEKETMEKVLHDICTSLQPCAKGIALISWHGGNIGMLNRFVETNKNSFQGVRLEHLTCDSEEVLKKTADILGGPVDEHAGNSEISMVLPIEPSLVTIPPKNYPKQKIDNAWDSDRLVDVSKDGIVDNHPQWVISKEMGEQFIEMEVQELKGQLEKMMK